MIPGHHIDAAAQAAQQAGTVTYAATGATVILWGLHATDIAVLASAFASILGVALQFYLAIRRIRRLEQRQVEHIDVTAALAASHRALEKQSKGKDSGG